MKQIGFTLNGKPSEWFWRIFRHQPNQSWPFFCKYLRTRFGPSSEPEELSYLAMTMKFSDKKNLLPQIDELLDLMYRDEQVRSAKEHIGMIICKLPDEMKRTFRVRSHSTVEQFIEDLKALYPCLCIDQ